MKQRVEPRITDEEAATIILSKPEQYGPLMQRWAETITALAKSSTAATGSDK